MVNVLRAIDKGKHRLDIPYLTEQRSSAIQQQQLLRRNHIDSDIIEQRLFPCLCSHTYGLILRVRLPVERHAGIRFHLTTLYPRYAKY